MELVKPIVAESMCNHGVQSSKYKTLYVSNTVAILNAERKAKACSIHADERLALPEHLLVRLS